MNRSEAGKLGSEKAKEAIQANKNKRIEKYNVEKKKCKECQLDLEYENRHKTFCSQSCSGTFNNKKRKIVYYCEVCNKQRKGRKKQKYCSVSCQQAKIKEAAYRRLESGDTSNLSARYIKQFLMSKYGAKCIQCGWDKVNQTSGNCPVELEHKDENSENNKLDNLSLLCPNCHSLTSTYKALNKGHGRHKRKMRYQEGKSY